MNKGEWERVIADSDVIRFENLGDQVIGIYKDMKRNQGQWKKNQYALAVEDEGKIKCKYIYGTKGLDDLFKNVPIGYEVKIIFKKEIPQRPPNKPFKVFEMYKRPVITDELESSNEDPEENDPLTENPEDNIDARDLISKITDHLLNEKGLSAEDITDDFIRKEAGLWYGKERITKDEYESLLEQLERKHVKNEE
jgi:hypothetical protein